MKEFNLSHFAEMVKNGEVRYTGTRKVVKANACSIRGYALELAVKAHYGLPLTISKARSNDIIFADENGARHFMEVKSNSSPIDGCLGRSSVMAYVFGVSLDKPLTEQWGYVLPLKSFMAIGTAMGHIKSGTTAGGAAEVEYKTQTVWNNSKGEPHGTKAYKLEDAYQASGAVSFKEWFK